MRIETIVCGPLDVNCYVLSGEDASCAVIDPAEDAPVIRYLEQEKLRCTHILLTHGHFDHIGGVTGLKGYTGAQVCIHRYDAPMLESDKENLAALMGYHMPPAKADLLLTDGDMLHAAGVDIAVLHTPGHTPGGVCYLAEAWRALFAGDTLFRLGAGRADFPGSDEVALYRSIAYKLFALPGEYILYPGHMRASTLSFEKEHNTFIRHYRGFGW